MIRSVGKTQSLQTIRGKASSSTQRGIRRRIPAGMTEKGLGVQKRKKTQRAVVCFVLLCFNCAMWEVGQEELGRWHALCRGRAALAGSDTGLVATTAPVCQQSCLQCPCPELPLVGVVGLEGIERCFSIALLEAQSIPCPHCATLQHAAALLES